MSATEPKTKQIGGSKNGGKRTIPHASDRAPKWYPADDIGLPKKSRKTPRPSKLRPSLTPGTVCVVLAGRYRGKRVVMLKQIADTILVTGPFKVNGVPLRRINPAYIIATSTKVDLSGASGLSLDKFNEAYFKVKKEKRGKSTEAEFFGDSEKKKSVPEERTLDQKAVDKAIIPVITKTPHMRSYLASSFSLSKGDKPHLLKF